MATAQELMTRLAERIAARPELRTLVGAVYQFVLDGPDGGSYLVDLKDALAVTPGEGRAGCTIRMTAGDFVDLFEGRANGQALFFTGKLKVEGDMALALKLQNLTDLLR